VLSPVVRCEGEPGVGLDYCSDSSGAGALCREHKAQTLSHATGNGKINYLRPLAADSREALAPGDPSRGSGSGSRSKARTSSTRTASLTPGGRVPLAHPRGSELPARELASEASPRSREGTLAAGGAGLVRLGAEPSQAPRQAPQPSAMRASPVQGR
jgi:hypothetical protein